ncbi:MAG: pantetheine-phosphate adenylyltransferase [Legionellales bacterium]|nr:pantetheine-phosphate adenylyltransferase [Legionellales bacterium]|tara:strand:+ start:2272 stop:2760 length:489 start_codon:yes stop_codon:yes gene_type:complete
MGIKGIFPGTFDPITDGHMDIINRASSLLDHLTIAIAHNPDKQHWLSLTVRMDMIQAVTKHLDNIEIVTVKGLVAQYAHDHNIQAIIRGIRSQQDLLFENQLALTNQQLNPMLETILMMASANIAHVSSSLVREIYGHNGNIEAFVPPEVFNYLGEHGPYDQ